MKSIVLVIDGFGVGACEDACHFGDESSNTYVNLRKCKDFILPTLAKLGLDNIDGLDLPLCDNVVGQYGKMREKSINKDTLTGHWEMMGIVTKEKYQSFPNVINEDVVKAVQELIGQTLCNHSASGTKIISELGKEHLETKFPILYSSVDSVLQIATHKDVFSIEELYAICSKIRERMNNGFNIQRIIARPFDTNVKGEFYRTKERKDFAISPPEKTIMQEIIEKDFEVVGVGKIAEIFNYQGVSRTFKTTNNEESLQKTRDLLKEEFNGLIFVNLIDTDMLYGHRNDVEGYISALEHIDKEVANIMEEMNDCDLLIITGDHGNDPTTISTDHSREFVPVLIYGKKIKTKNLGIIDGFNFVGETVLNHLKDYNSLSKKEF